MVKTKPPRTQLKITLDQIWQMYSAASSAFAGVSLLFVAALIAFQPAAIVGTLLYALLAFSITLPLSIVLFCMCLARIGLRLASWLLVLDITLASIGMIEIFERLNNVAAVLFALTSLVSIVAINVVLRWKFEPPDLRENESDA
jgi:hypothetical protein